MNKKLYILLVLVLFSFTSKVDQKGYKDTPTVLKALYIYNFATLTDWPNDYSKGNFTIAVYSSNSLVFNELSKKYKGKSIGKQPIKIELCSNLNDISKPNILFLDKTKSNSISSVNSTLKNKSTLLITNNAGFLGKGAIINFINVNSKQSYEINLKNAKKKKLVIAKKLSSLASKVIK